jgi:hypothetical protein
MRKTLVVTAVFAMALGLVGLVVALVPSGASSGTPSETLKQIEAFPDDIVAVASYRGQPSDPPGGGALPATTYVPIASQDQRNATIYAQNGAGNEGSVGITFYDTDGHFVHQINDSISAHGTLAYELATISGLPAGFEGSAIVSATQPIHVLINAQSVGNEGLLSYSGVPTGAKEIVLPNIARNYMGQDSVFLLQNVGDAPAEVTIRYYPMNFEGIPFVDTDTIPAFATHLFEQQGMSELGTRFIGWVHIQSDQPLAVVVELWNTTTGQLAAYNGLATNDADSEILVPRQHKYVPPDWMSTVQVSNLGTQDTDITTTWYTGDGSEVWSETRENRTFGQPEPYLLLIINDLPYGLDGALRGSADQPLAALNILLNQGLNGDGYALSQGTSLAEADTRMYLPRLAHVLTDGLNTELSIQNTADVTATVTLTFYHQSGSTTAVLTDDIAGHGFKRYSSTDVALLGNDWEGSVVIHAGEPVAAEVLQFLIGLPDIRVSPTSLATFLMSNRTRTLSLVVGNNGDAPLTWSLVESTNADWLSESPISGTVLPEDNTEVTVTFDAADLPEDIYTTTLQVSSDDLDTPLVTVPVTLTVQEFTTFLPYMLNDWPPPPVTLYLHGRDSDPRYFLSPNKDDGTRTIDGISSATEWVMTLDNDLVGREYTYSIRAAGGLQDVVCDVEILLRRGGNDTLLASWPRAFTALQSEFRYHTGTAIGIDPDAQTGDVLVLRINPINGGITVNMGYFGSGYSYIIVPGYAP